MPIFETLTGLKILGGIIGVGAALYSNRDDQGSFQFGEFPKAFFGETFGGIIADSFRLGIQKGYSSFKAKYDQIGFDKDNLNHDLIKTARKAQLIATFFAVQDCLQKIKAEKKSEDKGKLAKLANTALNIFVIKLNDEEVYFETLISYLDSEIKNIDKAEFGKNLTSEQFNAVFDTYKLAVTDADQQKIAKIFREEILQEIRLEIISNEFAYNRLEKTLTGGWEEIPSEVIANEKFVSLNLSNPKPSPIGRKYDWFHLVCSIFNEEYKANPKIQAAAQKQLLLDISQKLDSFGTFDKKSVKNLTKQISAFADDLKYLREGIDKANESLERLHNKVDKLNLQTISFYSNFPPNLDDKVYGRDAQITELISFLEKKKGHAIISALTCLGKTSLIRKFLYRHYDQEQNVSLRPDLFTDVLYLDCQQTLTFESLLRHFDAFLRTVSLYDDSDKAEYLRLNVFAKMSEHKVLLIFDNFEAWQADGKYLNQDIAVFVNTFIANSGNWRAIFLAWFSPHSEKEFLAQVTNLDVIGKSLEDGLEPEKAIELVRDESARYCQPDSLVDLDKVSETDLHKFFAEVNYIPQAIQSMVHFIGNQQCTFRQFLNEYKTAFAEEERSEENLTQKKDKKLCPTNALIKMQISLLNEKAKYLLSHLAFYGIDVPQDILILDLENTSAELSKNRNELNKLAKDRLVIRTVEDRDQEPFYLYHLHNFVYDAVIEYPLVFQDKYETHLENLGNLMNAKTGTAWENEFFNKLFVLVECWEKIEEYFVHIKKRTDRQSEEI